MSIRDAVVGIEEVLRKLESASVAYPNAAEAAIYGQWVALFELVNRKGMVPVATGALKASNYVADPVRQSGRVVVEAGYGQKYAAEVHEDQSRYGYGKGKRGYKWLEYAVNIHARSLQVRLQEATMAAFKRGHTFANLRGVFPSAPRVFDLTTAAGRREFKYAGKYGMSKEQRKLLRAAGKSGAVKMVRRWKTPKRGVSRAAMYPKNPQNPQGAK